MDRRDHLVEVGGTGGTVRALRPDGRGHDAPAVEPERDAVGVDPVDVLPVPREAGDRPVAEAPVPGDAVAEPSVARAPAPGSGQPAPSAETQPRKGRKRRAFLVILLLAALGGSYFGYQWWTVGRFMVSTDDAYVRADMTLLAAKVTGYVTEVPVENNQAVRAGDVIVRIDDGDYVLAVKSAKDKVATQQATIARIAEQVRAAGASADQARAQVAAAQADQTRAALELDRQNKLALSDYASKQRQETARADRDRSDAAVKGAQAALLAAQANVAVLKAQQVEAERTLGELQTAVAKAERDLSFTELKAPVDGVVGNKAVQVGQFVQAGQRLAALVPLADVYVDANFKETQLARLRPGQHVEISVDAFPGHTFNATVGSVSPASGAVFSLLPPENATGNFTKIVQRVPVRLKLDPEALREGLLRPGMSVIATVDIRSGGAPDPASAKPADWRITSGARPSGGIRASASGPDPTSFFVH